MFFEVSVGLKAYSSFFRKPFVLVLLKAVLIVNFNKILIVFDRFSSWNWEYFLTGAKHLWPSRPYFVCLALLSPLCPRVTCSILSSISFLSRSLDFAILRFLSWELPFSALALRYTLGSSALCVSDFTINFFGNCWFGQLAYLVSAYFCFSILRILTTK